MFRLSLFNLFLLSVCVLHSAQHMDMDIAVIVVLLLRLSFSVHICTCRHHHYNYPNIHPFAPPIYPIALLVSTKRHFRHLVIEHSFIYPHPGRQIYLNIIVIAIHSVYSMFSVFCAAFHSHYWACVLACVSHHHHQSAAGVCFYFYLPCNRELYHQTWLSSHLRAISIGAPLNTVKRLKQT